MSWLDGIRHSLRRVFRPGALDREHDEEVALHLELEAMQQRHGGLAPDAAERAARLRFGNRSYMREERRRMSPAALADRIRQDLRYGWRALRRSPAFTLVAVLSLGIGIGANTAIFGLIHLLLLAKLPVSHADELIELRRTANATVVSEQFSRAELSALRGGPVRLVSFSGMMGTIGVDGVTESDPIEIVDGGFFPLIGLSAKAGRLLSPGDDSTAASLVIVSDHFWKARLDADPDAVGRTVTLNDHRFTIVGITPPDYHGLRFPGIFDVALTAGAARDAGLIASNDAVAQQVVIVGLRARGADLASTEHTLAGLYDRCCGDGQLARGRRTAAAQRPHLEVVDISRGIANAKLDLRGQYARILVSLMGGVAVLLLVACANVGNLMLARATVRERELAVRLSLGASRGRLVMQLLVESAELAALGAIAGVALASWGTSLLVRLLPSDLVFFAPYLSARPNGAILSFTLAISLLCALLFGVLPAYRATRTDLVTPLKEGGHRATSPRGGLLDRGVVAVQVALALLLVSSAALLVGTLRNLRHTQLDFDPSHVVLATAETRGTPYEKQRITRATAAEMLTRLRAIPGIRGAALSSNTPIFGGRTATDRLVAAGNTSFGENEQLETVAITPGFFATMGIAVRMGRDFTDHDAPADHLAIVNQAFVTRYLPDRDPLGQTFKVGSPTPETMTIVGVVGDARYYDVRAPADPVYYVPITDGDWPFLNAAVRTSAEPEAIEPALMRALSDAAPGVSVRRPSTMQTSLDARLARERLSAGLAVVFGAVALGLAAIGLYGVMAYNVAGRTVEIGIRMALGADARSVLWLVLRQSLVVVSIGAVAGTPLALLAGRSIASQLYGVSPYDFVALGGATIVLVIVGVIASLLPARRAVSIDPLLALRAD